MTSDTKVIVGGVVAGIGIIVCGLAAVFMPDGRLEHLGRWLTDPATGTSLAGLIITVGGALYAARHKATTALVLGLLACALASGCGAPPLQIASVGVTVSLRALGAVDDAYDADLSHRQDGCPSADSAGADVHNACVDTARDLDLESLLDGLDIGIRAVGAAIAIAADVDAGQPLPDAVIAAVRQTLALFDQIEAALHHRGIIMPVELDMVVHVLQDLLGDRGADPSALMQASRVLVALRDHVASRL